MATARTERFTARQDLLQASVNFRNAIGGKNSTDLITFSIGKRSSVAIALTGLKADANLSLPTNQGTFSSRRRGKQNENLALTLEAGTYTVKVFTGRTTAKTKYRLSLQATAINTIPDPIPNPINTAPSLTANALFNANRNNASVINASFLKSIDAEQSSGQLTYRLTRLPTNGSLLFNNAPLALNSTFTQADIDSGRISYRNQSTKEIPNSNSSSAFVYTSGNNAAWISGSGSNAEIYFYNGATGQTKRLTTNSVEDSSLAISGSNAAWISGTGTNAEIYFYNGTTDATTRVTTNSRRDRELSLDGELVAWRTDYSDESDVQYSINGGSVAAVDSSTSHSDFNPIVSGSYISFDRSFGSNTTNPARGIYLFNTNTRASAIKLPFSDVGRVFNRKMFGSKVAWNILPDNTDLYDIYFYDGSNTFSIDNSNTIDDYLTSISGSGAIAFTRKTSSTDSKQVFWAPAISNPMDLRSVGSNVFGLPEASGTYLTWDTRYGSDKNVEYYNGSTTYSIDNGTRYNDDFSRISGSNIAFRRDDTLGAADDGWYLFDLEAVTTRRITSDITNLSVVGMNGKNVFLHNTANSRLLFYNGTTNADSFGFTVSDGSVSTSGTFNIGLNG
ncbi:hypothetical protein H6F67_00540 [Microcoleus sp. FACHB-1515]|uniref:cadherin-like domain-containing protein n=1 Tax=Cyanophyceae TaxID=3028117 RepID=UPI00168A16AC|nr:cadherin-like domain-containing protein [Microcoleus sp. FACHB-1515]MBD2088360.1 hypothetical protein [Microcoleus sp. FACHB-1515]